MKIKRYLCLTDGGGLDQADDGVLVPIDNFRGADLSGANTFVGRRIILHFIEPGDDNASKTSRIGIDHKPGKNREAMDQITTAFCSTSKDGFLLLDNDNDVFLPGSYNNVITGCFATMEV